MTTTADQIAEDAMRRLAGVRTAKRAKLFTSDLSVNEFLPVWEGGFRPLDMVLGSSIYQIAFQRGRWSQSQELEMLSSAMSDARQLAMSRMEKQARGLGADGVVGVRLDIEFKEFGTDVAEFIAVGTAVKTANSGSWRIGKGRPFTSYLSGQDFFALVRAGYAPMGMVMGSCVYHVAHQRFAQKLGNIGRNVEVTQLTDGLYAARELAMGRMQAEAKSLKAKGIVGIELRSLPHRWGGNTVEFFALGTAVKPLRASHTIDKPRLVLPLTD